MEGLGYWSSSFLRWFQHEFYLIPDQLSLFQSDFLIGVTSTSVLHDVT